MRPKANRADWMVEKLSELGVDQFIPLAAARSVVLPEGKNKLERWQRLSTRPRHSYTASSQLWTAGRW